MAKEGAGNREGRRETVKVRVAPEESMRFLVGSRWEVVASSVESLWEGQHTITLQEIVAGDER